MPAGWSRRLIEKLPRLASPQWPGYKKCLEGWRGGWVVDLLVVWLVGHWSPTSIPWTFNFMWSSRVVFPSFLFFQQ